MANRWRGGDDGGGDVNWDGRRDDEESVRMDGNDEEGRKGVNDADDDRRRDEHDEEQEDLSRDDEEEEEVEAGVRKDGFPNSSSSCFAIQFRICRSTSRHSENCRAIARIASSWCSASPVENKRITNAEAEGEAERLQHCSYLA